MLAVTHLAIRVIWTLRSSALIAPALWLSLPQTQSTDIPFLPLRLCCQCPPKSFSLGCGNHACFPDNMRLGSEAVSALAVSGV